MIEYFNEDCMAGMARYPDKYFDLAIVDPPYGIGIDGQKGVYFKEPKTQPKGHVQKDWDSAIPKKEYFDELFRYLKPNNLGAITLSNTSKKGTKGWIVWDKGQHGLTMSDAELAYSSFQKPTRVKVINRVELLIDGTIHPTQKPVALYKWLLTNYAKPGDLILDTHVGSASSLIACHDLGFDAVGFELDPDYYAGSKARLEARQRQITLEEFI